MIIPDWYILQAVDAIPETMGERERIMKIQVNPKDFLRRLQIAQKASAGRYTRPMLENVKIVVDKKRGIFLMATNCTIGIRIRVDGDVVRNGSVILPVERLVKTLKLSKDESVTLERSETGIVLESETKRAELQMGCDPADFPDVAEFPKKSGYCEIPAMLLQETIQRTVFSTDKDAMRCFLGGVCFESDGKTMDVVATDGRRMAWQSWDLGTADNSLIGQSIVPVATLGLLDKILKDKSIVDKHDDAKMLFQKTGVTFQCGDVTLFSRLVDGKFPKWKSHVPDKRSMPRVEVRCGDLLSAIRRATICTTSLKPAVRLVLDDGVLAVESRFVETVYGRAQSEKSKPEQAEESGKARIAIPVVFSGHAEFAVRPKEIVDFLSACKSATLLSVCLVSGEKESLVISPEDGYTFIVLSAEKSDWEERDVVVAESRMPEAAVEKVAVEKPSAHVVTMDASIPTPHVVIDGTMQRPLPVPDAVFDRPDEMLGGYTVDDDMVPTPKTASKPDDDVDWQAKFLQLQMENDQLQAKLETESEYAAQMPDDLESVLMDMVKESTASSIPNIAYLAMILSDVFPNLGHIATYAHKESERIRKPAHKKRGSRVAYA